MKKKLFSNILCYYSGCGTIIEIICAVYFIVILRKKKRTKKKKDNNNYSILKKKVSNIPNFYHRRHY